jgi:selenocysteine-specific elongation factor
LRSAIAPSYLVDGQLTLLDDAPGPLPRVSRARVDHGTAEVLVKVVLADRESLEPGDACYAQFRFEEQVLMYPGDQFIVRSVTPVTTIGGGSVLDPVAHKHGTGPQWRQRLALLEEGAPEAVTELLLQEAFPSYLMRGTLEASPYLWRSATPDINGAVAGLLVDGRAVAFGASAGGAGPTARLFHGPSFRALVERTQTALAKRAETDSLNPYLTLGQLRRELAGGKEWPALDSALEQLAAAGDIVRTEHGYRVATAAGADEPEDEGTMALLARFGAGPTGGGEETAALRAGAAETPTVAVAAESLGVSVRDAQRTVDALVRRGRLVKVGEDLYYPPERLGALMDRLGAAMEDAGQMTLAEARDLLGTSRRYAQALLEHMDSEGLTLRVGDARRLRRRRR